MSSASGVIQGYSASKRKQAEDATAHRAFLKSMDLDVEGMSDFPLMESLLFQHQQKSDERTKLKEKIAFTQNAIKEANNNED